MKWMWKSKIAKSLLGSFMFVVVPITLASLLVNYISMNIVNSEVSASYMNSVGVLSNQLTNSLTKFSLMAKNLYIDDDITAVAESPDDPRVLWDYANLLDKMKLYSSNKDLNANITIYMKAKNKAFSTISGLDNIKSDAFFNEYKDYANGTWVFKKAFGNAANGRSTVANNKDVLAYIQGIYAQKWEGSIAVTIEINVSDIKMLLKNLRVKKGGTAFIIGEDGYSVSANDENELNLGEYHDRILHSNLPNGQFAYEQNNKKYQVIYSRCEGTGLVLGMYFPQAQIMGPILKIRSLIFVFLFVSIGFAAFFTFFSYKNLLLPVHKMVNAMRQVRKGDLKARVEEEDSSELGFMLTQFNRMAAEVDLLFNEVYLERLKTQQTQLKFLQSQINPHFLYNCLYYIYMTSKAENTEASANMAMYLGEYFRYATRSNQDVVTLEEELTNIEAYVNIQKMRFTDKIDFHLEIGESTKNIMIPRLVIQPLVENAIIHGMENVARKGNIWLKANKQNGLLYITVEDDGEGIPLEKVQQLKVELEDLDKKTGSYGLSNTHWRLKLKFGEGAGISIESRIPNGTKVTAVMPCTKEEINHVSPAHSG